MDSRKSASSSWKLHSSLRKTVRNVTTAVALDLTLPVAREITRLIAEGARGVGGRPSSRGRLRVGGLEVLRAARAAPALSGFSYCFVRFNSIGSTRHLRGRAF